VTKIKRLQIKNRSPKALNAVQLRWAITYLDDQTKVLLEGTTPFVNFWAEADSAQVVEIPTIYPSLLFKPLAKDGVLNGEFMLRIGLQEARFTDGSFWRRRGPVVGFNYLYHDPIVADRFPSLASLSPLFPSWWAEHHNHRARRQVCPDADAHAFAITFALSDAADLADGLPPAAARPLLRRGDGPDPHHPDTVLPLEL
jgi:hypothetical protein